MQQLQCRHRHAWRQHRGAYERGPLSRARRRGEDMTDEEADNKLRKHLLMCVQVLTFAAALCLLALVIAQPGDSNG
jgi:hypothetical protein